MLTNDPQPHAGREREVHRGADHAKPTTATPADRERKRKKKPRCNHYTHFTWKKKVARRIPDTEGKARRHKTLTTPHTDYIL